MSALLAGPRACVNVLLLNDFSENLDDLVRTDERVRVVRNIDFERGVISASE